MATQTTTKEWRTVELQEIADVDSGGSAPQGAIYFEDGKYPFIRVQHFDGSKVYVDRCNLINDLAVKKYRLKKFEKDSIVFPKSGASIGLEKRAMLVADSYVVGHLCIIKSKQIDNKFLYFLLKQEKLASDGNGSTLPFLNISHIKRKHFKIPENPTEQKTISQSLTIIQNAISEQENLIVKYKELKRSMMQYLFTHGTKDEKTKMTEIGEIPESWEVAKLGDTGDVSYGIQAAVASLLKPIGFKILTNKNINLEGDIVLDKINYYQPKTKRELASFIGNGDILLNWRSGSKEHVGKTAIFLNDEKMLHSSFILRIRTNPEKVINKFLFYYLNWLRKIGYFVKLQTYSVNAKFNKSAVLAMDIAVPSINQQIKILEALDTISNKLEIEKIKLLAYQNLFKTLLHELMSGERRIKI